MTPSTASATPMSGPAAAEDRLETVAFSSPADSDSGSGTAALALEHERGKLTYNPPHPASGKAPRCVANPPQPSPPGGRSPPLCVTHESARSRARGRGKGEGVFRYQ